MLTENEAEFAFQELLDQLDEVNPEIVRTIQALVDKGRVETREGDTYQYSLTAIESLATGLRVVTAWLEPALMLQRVRQSLATEKHPRASLRWSTDRVDRVVKEHHDRTLEDQGETEELLVLLDSQNELGVLEQYAKSILNITAAIEKEK